MFSIARRRALETSGPLKLLFYHRSICSSNPRLLTRALRQSFHSAGPSLDSLYDGTRKLVDSPSQPAGSTTRTIPEPTARNSTSDIPTKPKLSFRSYIYATLCLLVGSLGGNFVSAVITPPLPPVPNTPQDCLMKEYLHEKAEALPLVQSLTSDPLWVSEELSDRLATTGPLAGSRALGGYLKTFRHSQTGEIVQVIWIGPAVAGWPGVTHGGLTATILYEIASLCALKSSKDPVTFASQFDLDYIKPVLTNNFYVVRATTAFGEDKQQHVSGSLETISGSVCVEASTRFLVTRDHTSQ
ncbi:thioesterase family protein [Blumeria hordei DH14]|uniref:Thioesterase family protein n=1 Tax=Blumeria graminis f. sp. hordei (strain DH14) TaxID=546991 RepID=N1JBI1_BLUG1|nr:thioesterase family protein [Blumeria hordei DH14]